MTLTEAAFWTKRFGVIVIAFISVLTILFLLMFRVTEPPAPPEYLTPNYACTDTRDEFLEHTLSIPSLEVLPDSEMLFKLETDSGKLDNLPRIVNVYRYTNLGQILNSQADAKILAKKLGFDPEKIVRKGTTEYIWVNNQTQRSLNVNAKDLNFVFKTNLSKIRSIRKSIDLPTEAEAISQATNTLRTLGILEREYTEVQPSVFLIDINPDDTYSEADSLANAELIRIDFHKKIPMISIQANIQGVDRMISSLTRKNMTYDLGTKVVNEERVEVYNFSTLMTYQNPLKSNISVYVGPKDESLESLHSIYQIEYRTWSVEVDSCGTYELISPALALQKIQNGEGSLVFLNYNKDEVIEYTPQTIKSFTVNDLYITYYEGLFEQQFLQPVYMVEGQAELNNGEWADFHIYYPAINYATVQDKIELPQVPVQESSGFLF